MKTVRKIRKSFLMIIAGGKAKPPLSLLG